MNSIKQLQAQEEVRARREEEARRLRLEQETAADMAVLRAILDAERSACEIESAAERHRAGLDGRIRAAAPISPVSSSTAKRIFSISCFGSTSQHRPYPWLQME